MKIDQLYSLFLNCSSISTDTRSIPKDALFFALKGDNFNGNQFAEQAIASGALYAIVDEKEHENKENNIFWVKDTLVALQALAQYHRNTMKTPILALTGSNGKTTTKELITKVLQKKLNTLATIGNLNNHIGVPLTLLRIKEHHDLAVVEMGANHQKEIEFLCEIAAPDFGYITNFGKAHLEGFGGEEGVIKGKSELYHYLRNHSKTAFVNADDSKQLELTYDTDTISFGTQSEAGFHFQYHQNFEGKCPELTYNSISIQSQLVGEYNISNVAAAVAIGLHFEVPIEDIKQAIEAYTSGDNRSQIIQKENCQIILDAYNANPSSMEAALYNFHLIKGEKMVILGDMFELGTASKAEHQRIAELAHQLHFDQILLIGKNFHQIQPIISKKVFTFDNKAQAGQHLTNSPNLPKNILIKGSRGMALETLVDLF
ncbi:MAG TPA: UDP-N-acetylmuramoyl-tripeptide--D-alanyl-D-alanine ligase [Moheibacter sp.]|nr:UDP-N-acetylmuramoyl-tripeptide--D-alanyl-D-alanine ligase [Moheibacter sp.]